MIIELHDIPIHEVASGYTEIKEEGGVVGYGGRLNIRPAYQREFVYDNEKRDAVLDSIRKGFPLNVMYWIINEEGNYEMLDGQQRTLSFCQYINGDFSINYKYFHNLTKTEQEQILNYGLKIYFCEGNDKEKLDWFKIINTAGDRLTDQEALNAIYTGPWLADAKLWFSKTGCAAYRLADKYVEGSPIRQEYLETALKWISKSKIEDYMSIHQHDPNANELWTYFKNVIDWVRLTFPNYRREMKGIGWGGLYDEFKDKLLDTAKLEAEIMRLMIDDDVSSKKGIYTYVLMRDERNLNIRKFTEAMKRVSYEQQKGICPVCKQHFEFEQMEGDHITPWSKGGPTTAENCRMLCKEDNRRKSDI